MKRKERLLSFISRLILVGLTLGMMFSYQNCAETVQTDSASSDESTDGSATESSLDPTGASVRLPGHTGEANGHEFLLRKNPKLTNYGFQLMNKHQILSTFTYVFGNDVRAPALQIEVYLSVYYAQFGGPCNLHEPVRYRDKTTRAILFEGSVTRDCNSTTLSYTPAQPALTSSREALMDKVCGRAVGSMLPLRHALALVDHRNTATALASIDSDPATGAASKNLGLYKAFRLFYPTQPDPRSASPALMENLRLFFANPAKPTLQEWQTTLYTLCISPYWQVL